MKRMIPASIYEELPCSVVAVGCALGIADPAALRALTSPSLHEDGYLSLKGMDALVRANLPVRRCVRFRRGERPALETYTGGTYKPAIVCVEGHFLYTNGFSYWSFFENASDRVVAAWELREMES